MVGAIVQFAPTKGKIWVLSLVNCVNNSSAVLNTANILLIYSISTN